MDFCPYELFLNTKSDIGPCPSKYHEESLRDKFRGPEGDRYRQEWERDFYNFIERLLSDLERKLRKGRDRLERPGDSILPGNSAIDELEERRTILDLQIREKLAKIEEYGEQGEISKAQELSEQVDAMRAEVEQILKQEADNPNFRLEKRMEVCQTCGAFLIVGDALKRIESHYEGRQHTGWARVRQTVAELQARGYGTRSSSGRRDDRRDYDRRREYDRDRERREEHEQGEIPHHDHRRDHHRGSRDYDRRRDDRNGHYARRDRSPYRR